MDHIALHEDSEGGGFTPAMRAKAAKKSTLVSVAVNVVMSTAQIVIGLAAHSQALIADGIHSLSDLIADFVVLLANHHSQKDADEDHPYGHQRFETAASLVLGVLLIAVALGMLWTAFEKLKDPSAIPAVHRVALGVAIVGLLAKEFLFRYMLRVAKKVKSSMLVANAWHARSDAASSLVVSLGIIGNLLGYTILDPIAALIVGLMVGKMGWDFGYDAFNDLMDRSVDNREVQGIRTTLLKTPGVLGVHDIRTRKMGDMIVVDAHLEVDGSLTVIQGHDIAEAAEHAVRRRHRVLNVLTHVDPVSVVPEITAQPPEAPQGRG